MWLFVGIIVSRKLRFAATILYKRSNCFPFFKFVFIQSFWRAKLPLFRFSNVPYNAINVELGHTWQNSRWLMCRAECRKWQRICCFWSCLHHVKHTAPVGIPESVDNMFCQCMSYGIWLNVYCRVCVPVRAILMNFTETLFLILPNVWLPEHLSRLPMDIVQLLGTNHIAYVLGYCE